MFTLIGEPPFTFTYQRAELSPRKGAQGKVLETHTVSGVTTKEYSIFSALEGAYFMSMSMRLVKKVALCLTIVCNQQGPGLLRRSPTDTADIRPRNRTVERSLGDDRLSISRTKYPSCSGLFACNVVARTIFSQILLTHFPFCLLSTKPRSVVQFAPWQIRNERQ